VISIYVVAALPLILVLCAVPSVVKGDATTPAACQSSAASFYYLAKFTSWPESAPMQGYGSLWLCVFGNHPLNDCIAAAVKGKVSHGKPFEVRHPNIAADISPCAMVLVGKMPAAEYASVSEKLDHQPVLTIGSVVEFPAMVHLKTHNDKPRLAVDLRIVQKAGLRLSSELLHISTVEGEKGATSVAD